MKKELSLTGPDRPAAYNGQELAPLYRAYMQGAYDALGGTDGAEREHSFRLTLAAMCLALVGWVVTVYFVFK